MDRVPVLRIFSAVDNLAQPAYFLVVSSLSIVFCLRYFNESVYRVRGVFTDHFKKKFKISKRECEVITLLLTGAGSKAIGADLSISTKTAENHIYNIFKKCGVTSRLQLHQLIGANSAE